MGITQERAMPGRDRRYRKHVSHDSPRQQHKPVREGRYKQGWRPAQRKELRSHSRCLVEPTKSAE
jgi:hypothetical protein